MLIVDVYYERRGEEWEDRTQFCDLTIIPRVGERFSFYSDRDTDGHTFGDRQKHLRFDGFVERVEYILEQGMEHSENQLMFVSLFLRRLSEQERQETEERDATL